MERYNANQVLAEAKRLGWDGVKPIKIWACNAGTGDNSLAQQMADISGVDIIAADNYIGWDENGNWVIGTPKDGVGFADLLPSQVIPNGNFKRFSPSGRKK